ncbi:hypothetical protein P7C73_g6356, partial [Tremellales sp. Uapishka_1]
MNRITPPKSQLGASQNELPDLPAPRSDGLDTSKRNLRSEFEISQYYYGIPSSPRLCGTSRYDTRLVTDNWGPRTLPKRLSPIDDHPILTKWSTIAIEITRYLARADCEVKVEWTTIDLCRLGFDSEEQTPVIWIGVQPGTLSLEDGNTAAKKIRNLFGGDYPDIEVELRESVYTLLVGPRNPENLPPFPPPLTDLGAFYRPFAPYLGLPIASTASSGTGGFYVEHGGDLYLVTCRHIVLSGTDFDPGLAYQASSTTDPKIAIVGPPQYRNEWKYAIGKESRRLREMTGTTGMTPEELEARYRQLLQQLGGTASDLLNPLGDRRGRAALEKLVGLGRLAGLMELYDNVQVDFPIGEVAFSPPWTQKIYKNQIMTPDIALIKVDADRFANIANQVLLAGFIGPGNQTSDGVEVLKRLRHSHSDTDNLDVHNSDRLRGVLPHDHQPEPFGFPSDRVLRLSGIIPLTELGKPTTFDIVRDKYGAKKTEYRHLKVMKHGQRSNITFGRGNAVMSLVRTEDWNGGQSSGQSVKWPIFAEYPSHIFADRGDSGAAVFDGRGRIGGMIVGGCTTKPDETSECFLTYTTPAEFIFQHLRETFGDITLASSAK